MRSSDFYVKMFLLMKIKYSEDDENKCVPPSSTFSPPAVRENTAAEIKDSSELD